MISHTSRGGCHFPDYRAVALILLIDVDCTHTVTMRTEATATFEAPALGFMSIFTPGTGRRGVCFVLKHDFAAKHVPLVGDQVSEPAVAPLVKLLVGPFAIIQSLTNISHIPDHERLHPCLEQGGDQCPRLFVFNVSYLVLDSGKMPLL